MTSGASFLTMRFLVFALLALAVPAQADWSFEIVEADPALDPHGDAVVRATRDCELAAPEETLQIEVSTDEAWVNVSGPDSVVMPAGPCPDRVEVAYALEAAPGAEGRAMVVWTFSRASTGEAAPTALADVPLRVQTAEEDASASGGAGPDGDASDPDLPVQDAPGHDAPVGLWPLVLGLLGAAPRRKC